MHRVLLAVVLLAWSVGALALDLELDVGSAVIPGVPGTITDIHVACGLDTRPDATTCKGGRVGAKWQGQPLEAHLDGTIHRDGAWSLAATAALRGITYSEVSGRYATDHLDLDLVVQGQGDDRRFDGTVHAAFPRGQGYVEPVFVDFGPAPATLDAVVHLDRRTGDLRLDDVRFAQQGVVRATGTLTKPAGAAPDADLVFEDLTLGPAFATWVAPFLAGTPLEKAALEGAAHGRATIARGVPQALELTLGGAGIEAPGLDLGMHGVTGDIHWKPQGPTPPSSLRWDGGHLAKLDIGGAALALRVAGRDVELLAPLRLPLAGGALNVHDFAVGHAGQPDMTARFDAGIEPIDLATLCRAFGWPEFGGTLAGRLPGLHLEDQQLRLDGALTAHAFDGEITVDGLRVKDLFGRVPRLLADIHLRRLDLAALTGAFSFGRIEGRLDGDVEDLRLLGWQPVAFAAALGTTPGDDSRHRISQRAIDNISSIGGGPTGLLSRGALRFFKDFGYDRIGWSCTLADGVCAMDGLGPAKDGGYVLVKGKLLPRIDVIGYEKRVDWNTFVSQLQAARHADAVQVK